MRVFSEVRVSTSCSVRYKYACTTTPTLSNSRRNSRTTARVRSVCSVSSISTRTKVPAARALADNALHILHAEALVQVQAQLSQLERDVGAQLAGFDLLQGPQIFVDAPGRLSGPGDAFAQKIERHIQAACVERAAGGDGLVDADARDKTRGHGSRRPQTRDENSAPKRREKGRGKRRATQSASRRRMSSAGDVGRRASTFAPGVRRLFYTCV